MTSAGNSGANLCNISSLAYLEVKNGQPFCGMLRLQSFVRQITSATVEPIPDISIYIRYIFVSCSTVFETGIMRGLNSLNVGTSSPVSEPIFGSLPWVRHTTKAASSETDAVFSETERFVLR